MKTLRPWFAATLAAALAAPPAFAAQRTFVASFGNDANPCSIISPCRGIARALTQTDPGGEVLVLDSAGYGAFTINQSVSIIAPDGVYAGISVFAGAPNASHGIVVNGPNINVTLRGLSINGLGGDDGIRIESANRVFIEKVVVANTGNNPADAGIRVAPGAALTAVFITDTTVRRTAGAGISSQSNTSVHVDRCRIEANGGDGIEGLAPGGRLTVTESLLAGNLRGLRVGASAVGNWIVTVARSTIDGNEGQGLNIGSGSGGNYRVAVRDSVLSRNGVEGILLVTNSDEAATAVLSDNLIADNADRGISCGSVGGPASLAAERNVVSGNNRAFSASVGCTFDSLGNNAVRNNANPDQGIINSATLR